MNPFRVWLLLVGLALAGPLMQTTAMAQAITEKAVIATQAGQQHVFTVEMARSVEQKRRGLMFRTSLAADAGMMFDFQTPQLIAMWMKNTLIPLDMLFIDDRGRIVFIAENTTPESLDTIAPPSPARAVLEVAGGTAARLKLAVGDRVRWPSGPQP